MPDDETPFEFRTVPVEHLRIDPLHPSHNRVVSPTLVTRIATDFKPALFGMITVTPRRAYMARPRLRRFARFRRPVTRYSIADGVLRYEGAKAAGVSTLPCMVIDDDSR